MKFDLRQRQNGFSAPASPLQTGISHNLQEVRVLRRDQPWKQAGPKTQRRSADEKLCHLLFSAFPL